MGASGKYSRVLYLPRDPTLSAVFYRTARVYGAFTDLLVLLGRISKYFCSDGSGAMLLGRLVL